MANLLNRPALVLSVCLLACLLTTGCATMVNGPHQTLSVDSFPSHARVSVDCGDTIRIIESTPAKISVSRSADHCELTFMRDGYETKSVLLSHQLSRATALNAAFGVPSAVVMGLVGAIAGSTVNGTDTGARIGGEAGYDLGREGATAIDKKGGGWKWVPARVFVVLAREPEAASEPPNE
jgi:hypothetical protein